MGDAGTGGFDWTLRDGTRLHLRPVRADDKQRLKDALPHISAENLYRRFFMPVVQLSERQLRFLTEVDQVQHIAWVALAADQPGEPLVGVARCVRFEDQPGTAEAAILVVDRWQHLGAGTLLLALLGLVAARNGIRLLRSFALEENLPFLRTMARLGARSRWEHANVLRVDLPVIVDQGAVAEGHPFKGVLAEVAARLA